MTTITVKSYDRSKPVTFGGLDSKLSLTMGLNGFLKSRSHTRTLPRKPCTEVIHQNLYTVARNYG